MDKNLKNEMEAGGIQGFRELKLSYNIAEARSITTYTVLYTFSGSLI